METDLEEIGISASNWVAANRRALFFVGLGIVALALLSSMKEVTSLLMLSYLLAVLLEPLVKLLSRIKLSRSLAITAIMAGGIFFSLLFLFIILPPVIGQYSQLITDLPVYAERFAKFLSTTLTTLGFSNIPNLEGFVLWAKERSHGLRPEHLRHVTTGLMNILLEGYSLTLMMLNLTLLPFFLFYISVDLNEIHKTVGSLFPEDLREKLTTLAKEILEQIYAFFKGQITVSAIMAVLYAIGLTVIGVPSGLAIGLLAGILNVVPYLGVIVGLLLAIGSVLISTPGITPVLLVLLVFGVVQFLEGVVLTPKIVGEKTGIPPLGVMLALLIGGQLLGIAGLIVAIPAAAAAKVIIKFLWREVKADEILPSLETE